MTTMPPSTLSPKRGDVVLVLFPNSDLITAKARPALVAQADDLNTGIPRVILALITTRMSRVGHPSRVTVLTNTEEGQGTGLLHDAVIMTDNLATVSVSAISRVIGLMPVAAVDAALRHTLDLP